MSLMKKDEVAKVPEVTLIFWAIKILATTLGETGGDAVSMSMGLGYFMGSLIFFSIFLLAAFFQIKSARFHPLVYWLTVIATTTVGTTLADFTTRSVGIGYSGGTLLLTCLLISSLFAWYRSMGTISISSIRNKKSEIFYWVTIMFSQTLGTALGDWTAGTANLGYSGAAVIFGALLLTLVVLYYKTNLARTWLFWSAFILTRPLGAVLGDWLDKPASQGGLELSRYVASAVLTAAVILLIAIFKQHPAKKTH